jgi:hypothetical protein
VDGFGAWMIAGAALLAGVVLGAFLHAWWVVRQARAQRRIPAYWPLTMRLVANSEERRVWRWLSRAFFDHHVMIKMPVTRFTLPRSKDEGGEWHEMLNAAYCTFTIVDSEGRVVGCVDVPGHVGISKSTRVLKQSLLDQCGISYWVVTSSSLPALADIRREFLGPEAAAVQPGSRPTVNPQVTNAQGELRATLERKRSSKRVVEFDPMTSDPADFMDSKQLEEFDPRSEPNSFLAPLDSRLGELR